ncbi:unnamed protein product [Calypogeia fissa]
MVVSVKQFALTLLHDDRIDRGSQRQREQRGCSGGARVGRFVVGDLVVVVAGRARQSFIRGNDKVGGLRTSVGGPVVWSGTVNRNPVIVVVVPPGRYYELFGTALFDSEAGLHTADLLMLWSDGTTELLLSSRVTWRPLIR